MPAPFDPEAFTAEAKRNWNAAVEPYDKLSASRFPPVTQAFLSFIGLRAGQRVLDVACGPGTVTRGAAEAVGPEGRVVGIDLSPGMLKLAMSRATQPNLEYREMSADALDFPDALFDVVLCQLGLMLFARPQQSLTEMVRVCKRGGVTAGLVQGTSDKMLFTSLVMRALFKQNPNIKQPGAPNLYAFGPAGVLEKALEEAGLREVVADRLSGFFLFDSPLDYWTTMTEGAGRTGRLVRELPDDKSRIVREEVLAAAESLTRNGKTEIPYEVVMAKGRKP